jgi:hypothetical protein
MSDITAALSTLGPEEIGRVLQWAVKRFNVAAKVATTKEAGMINDEQGASAQATYKNFHELFDAANPETAAQKALVGAYWFQVVQQQEEFDSHQVNNELKNLGHVSKNITRDLNFLMGSTPRQVMQVRKEGSGKMARKRSKLTREGIKEVERMISAGG